MHSFRPGTQRVFSVNYLFGEANIIEFSITYGRLKISKSIHVQFSKLI